MNTFDIGTPDSPLPVYEDGELFLHADNVNYLSIPTAYSGDKEDVQKKLLGIFWRGLPSRSLLPQFIEELKNRNYNRDIDVDGKSKSFGNRNMAFGVIGDPGIGKTFMYETLGRIQHPQGAVFADLSNFDCNKLFVTMALDTANINAERNAIDARIKMYNSGDQQAISANGIALLENMFKESFYRDEESGKISVDWDNIGEQAQDEMEREQQAKAFTSLLQQFCSREGIEVSANLNSVGFVEKDGSLIRALEQGKPFIGDEITRNAKNLDRLYGVLNFLNSSNRKEITLTGANGREIRLDRDDFPPTFVINFNGNPVSREMGTSELNQPFRDRVSFMTLPNPTEMDFVDLTCSVMTGVPISIIKETHGIEDGDAKTLSEYCKYYRTLDSSAGRARAVPREQMIYLDNAEQFLEVAKCVGKTIYELYEFKNECKKSAICEDAALREHIAKQPISPRVISKLFETAATYLPVRKVRRSFNPFADNKAPLRGNTTENRMLVQGEGLEKAFFTKVQEMFSCPQANPDLATPVLKFANNILYQNGIGEEEFTEAKSVHKTSENGENATRLKYMFNFSDKPKASPEAMQLQDVMYEILLNRYGNKIPADKDEVFDPFSIESFLAELRQNEDVHAKISHKFLGKAITINEDIETSQKLPLEENMIINPMHKINGRTNSEKLVSQDAFLFSLCVGGLKEANLKNLWNRVPQKMYEIMNDAEAGQKEHIKMAAGNSEAKIAVTSLQLAHNSQSDRAVFLDMIYNQENQELLIVGNRIGDKMKSMLARNKVTFVERGEKNAGEKIDEWINVSMLGLPKSKNAVENDLANDSDFKENNATKRTKMVAPVVKNAFTALKLQTGDNSDDPDLKQLLLQGDHLENFVPKLTTFHEEDLGLNKEAENQPIEPENIMKTMQKLRSIMHD